MINSLSSLPGLAVPTRASTDDPVITNQVKSADKALNALINDPALLQSLTDQTLTYIPPTSSQVLSTIWALVNTKSADTLSREDVQNAVRASGGSVDDAYNLWKLIVPDNQNTVSAEDFTASDYLKAAVGANLTAEQDTVEHTRLMAQVNAAAATSNILDLYSGSSPVGESSGVNIFI